MPGRQPLEQEREARAVVDAGGERHGQGRRRRRVLGVAAGAAHRHDALAGVLAHARDLGAGDQRERRLGEVLVAALVGVGEVDPRARDADQHLAVAGLWDRELGELEHLGAAELLHLDRMHGAGPYLRPPPPRLAGLPRAREPCTLTPPMSVTVVGSLAYDAVRTPFGSRERMLGGAATHFALAASFFDEVRVVGPVGDDFREEDMEILRTRGTVTDDVERVAGGKTFFWSGEYGDNLNSRETITTELNVFEHFQPKLSDASRASDVLFLANIQPDLQLAVREECRAARFVAMDSMDLWINIAHDALVKTIRTVDCLILNDEELEMLTGAPTTVAAAQEILGWGLTAVVAKQGKYGATLFTGDDVFALPAYPLEQVVDPTGAGDTFAGGFVGYVAAQGGDATHEELSRAMAYGTALASYNVEEFGTERVARLTAEEIAGRVSDLHRMTAFTEAPVALRG
jgi:sugar/nucleoside kinase (ribokinase family)